MATEVHVPSTGESVTEATVANWLKRVGDPVSVDEPLVELETEKASMEVPSPVAGVIASIAVEDGTDVAVGSLLCVIDEGATAAGVAKDGRITAGGGATASAAPPAGGPATAVDGSGPAVARLLAEYKLDGSKIPASGKDGRLTKGDVLAFVEKGGAAAAPSPRPAPIATPPAAVVTLQDAGPLPPRPEDPREERVRMTKLRRTIARRLKDAQNTAAMLTTFNEVDMQNAMDMRAEYKEKFEKKHGSRLGFMSFFVKAVVQGLKELPAINAEIHGDTLIYKNYYDIGVAVGSPQGLVVPVLRDADKMSFAEVESTIADFGKRARDGKLTMAEMMGGTFTVTNGGVFGSLLSTPILNPPQSGILGMHKTQPRPVAVGDTIEIRPMMYTALSYDHRIVDGREAVTFLVRVKECLEDPRRLLLEM